MDARRMWLTCHGGREAVAPPAARPFRFHDPPASTPGPIWKHDQQPTRASHHLFFGDISPQFIGLNPFHFFGGRRVQGWAKHRLFHPVGDGVVADAEEPFRRPLANPFQILRQSGGLRFGGHQAAVLFPESLMAGWAAPALVAVAGGSILDAVGSVAERAVHAKYYRA